MKTKTNKQGIILWLERKLAEAEKELKFRLEDQALWREGTDEEWAASGCRMNRTQRLEISAEQGRIAENRQHDIEMLKRAIQIVSSLDKAKGGKA
jgi:hypothetical protein